MHTHCAYGHGSGYWIWGIAIALVWWLVGSALLWVTWNRVIGSIAKIKPVKYWQALLFIFTVVFLWAPRFCPHVGAWGCHGHSHCQYAECDHGGATTPDKGE